MPLFACAGAAYAACGSVGSGKRGAAVDAFKADLATYPENAWALRGLLDADPGNASLRARFAAAAARADVTISSPCPALPLGAF
jgi:hypothetical protein